MFKFENPKLYCPEIWQFYLYLIPLFKVARTMPLRKMEKMIDFYIFCKTTGLEKFTGANCDQIGPLVETLSSLSI